MKAHRSGKSDSALQGGETVVISLSCQRHDVHLPPWLSSPIHLVRDPTHGSGTRSGDEQVLMPCHVEQVSVWLPKGIVLWVSAAGPRNYDDHGRHGQARSTTTFESAPLRNVAHRSITGRRASSISSRS